MDITVTLRAHRITIYGSDIEILEMIRLRMYRSKYRRQTYKENALEPLLPKRVPVEFYGLQHNKQYSLPFERIENFHKVTAQYVKEQAGDKAFRMNYNGTGISFSYYKDGKWAISMNTTANEKETMDDLLNDLTAL